MDRFIAKAGGSALAALLAIFLAASPAMAGDGKLPVCRDAQTDAALAALFQTPGSQPASVGFDNWSGHSVDLDFDTPKLHAELFGCLEKGVSDEGIDASFELQGEGVAPAQSRLIADIVKTLFGVADANAAPTLQASVTRCVGELPPSITRTPQREGFKVYVLGFAIGCEVGPYGAAEATVTRFHIGRSVGDAQRDRWTFARVWTKAIATNTKGRPAWRKTLKSADFDREGLPRARAVAVLLAAAAKDTAAGGGHSVIGDTRCDTRRFFPFVRAVKKLGARVQLISFQTDMMTIAADVGKAGVAVVALECLTGEPPAVLFGLGGELYDEPDGPGGEYPAQPEMLTTAKRDAIATIVARDLHGDAAAFRSAFAKCYAAKDEVVAQAGGLGLRCYDEHKDGENSMARLVLTTGGSR